MSGSDETIRVLRASPDNVSLRLHLADTILTYGRPEEAEQEYREVIARARQNQPAQTDHHFCRGWGNGETQRGNPAENYSPLHPPGNLQSLRQNHWRWDFGSS